LKEIKRKNNNNEEKIKNIVNKTWKNIYPYLINESKTELEKIILILNEQMKTPKTQKELFKQMTNKLFEEIKEINNKKTKWNEFKLFFDENFGAIGRANYTIFGDIDNNFTTETMRNILPIGTKKF